MYAKPSLSIIIPWKDRPELSRTIAENSRVIKKDIEIIVANCGSRLGKLRSLLAHSEPSNTRYVDCLHPVFNKSIALNIGAFLARSSRLFLLDADVIVNQEFLAQALRRLRRPCFVTVDRLFEFSRRPSRKPNCLIEYANVVEFVVSSGRRVAVETNRVRFADESRSAPGLIMLRRQHFIEVGGMNSVLTGWGWEDLDLIVRLRLGLRLTHCSLGSATHITHAHHSHSDERGQLHTEARNFETCLGNYSLADYRGSYREDVMAWKRRSGWEKAHLHQD